MRADPPNSQTAFSTTLTNLGYDKKHTEVGKLWFGLALASDSGE